MWQTLLLAMLASPATSQIVSGILNRGLVHGAAAAPPTPAELAALLDLHSLFTPAVPTAAGAQIAAEAAIAERILSK